MAPRISVVIPTYERPDLLRGCLDRLRPGSQTLAADLYEVIVSDDSASSTTREMIERDYPRVRWVKGPRDGPAANRNNGAQFAEGEWLAFTDDDCLPDSDWLQAFAAESERGGARVLEGRTETPDKVDSPFAYGVENLTGGLFWSCNLFVGRSTFFDLGRFDQDFKEAGGEDMEFAWRLSDKKIASAYCPQALVLHPVRRLTLSGIVWRTRLSRWLSLYRLKAGLSPPLSTPLWRCILWLLYASVLNNLRESARCLSGLLRGERRHSWRTDIFQLCWKWLTLPVVLPYQLYWELRFRRQLTQQ